MTDLEDVTRHRDAFSISRAIEARLLRRVIRADKAKRVAITPSA